MPRDAPSMGQCQNISFKSYFHIKVTKIEQIFFLDNLKKFRQTKSYFKPRKKKEERSKSIRELQEILMISLEVEDSIYCHLNIFVSMIKFGLHHSNSIEVEDSLNSTPIIFQLVATCATNCLELILNLKLYCEL